MRCSLLLLCAFLVIQRLPAQEHELGLAAGMSLYGGDVGPEVWVPSGPSFSLMYRYHFNERIAWSPRLYYGLVRASDRDARSEFRRARNLEFETEVMGLGLQWEFSYLPYLNGNAAKSATPYLIFRADGLLFDPMAVHPASGEWVRLRELGTEGQGLPGNPGMYSTWTLGLGTGMGYRWSPGKYWNLMLEVSLDYLFTDYLDDVSTVYPDRTTLQAQNGQRAADMSDRSAENGGNRIGTAGSMRGNPQFMDALGRAELSISYTFHPIRCPRFK